VLFTDVEPRKGERKSVSVPESVKRIRVLPPFQVVYETHPYTGGDTVEVPESIADDWILNQWVVEETPEPPRKRGR
jgi:hypothetical protein